MNDTATFFDEELTSIHAYLDSVRAALGNGHMPDMTGLENRVGVLCRHLQEAEKTVQQAYVPRLEALMRDLDDCEHCLRASFEAQMQRTPDDGRA